MIWLMRSSRDFGRPGLLILSDIYGRTEPGFVRVLTGANRANYGATRKTDVVGRHNFVFYFGKDYPVTGRSSVPKSHFCAYPVVAVLLSSRMARIFLGRAEFDEDTGHLIPALEIEDLTTARAIVSHGNVFSSANPLQLESSCIRAGSRFFHSEGSR
jgi:hypothetical protein